MWERLSSRERPRHSATAHTPSPLAGEKAGMRGGCRLAPTLSPSLSLAKGEGGRDVTLRHCT